MLIEQLALYPLAWGLLLIILGLIVGSFLNVVILRMPRVMEHEWKSQCRELLEIASPEEQTAPPPNIVYPASHCPNCKARLLWWHNIPVLSYLLLRGKCHACEQSISIRYPAIEILTALLTLLTGLHFPETHTLPWILIVVWSLITMSVIDYDTQILPDNLTLPLMWLGLMYAALPMSLITAEDAILGAASGYMVLWLLYQAHFLLTRREGMGYGDFKLLAAAGAWLGWQDLPFLLLIAAVSGLIVSLILIIFRDQDKRQPVPFGPHLAIAFFIMLFWGDTLVDRYLVVTGIGA